MRRLLKRLFSESPAEELLLYADTEIMSVSSSGGIVTVKGVDYCENPFALGFTSAEVVVDRIGDNLRVEGGRVEKLPVERKKIVLNDDDGNTILSVEFAKCKTCQPDA